MSKKTTKSYDVAAYIWPSYHPDDRAKIFWPMGIGEWETVMKNTARFEGHEQPRYPLWGYVNEADPYVMEMQIEAAVDHGVNVFIYDWYWYDGMPFLEGCVNDGFLGAKNNHKMKFYIMWANHDVGMLWDRRNSDSSFRGQNRARIWKGGVDRKEFEVICHRIIEKYFSHPSYYRIDGKPVFMLYELRTFINGIGGVDEARSALEWFRAEVEKAGFPGLELQVTLRRDSAQSMAGIPGDNVGTQQDVVEQLGFQSLTHYQFVHFGDVNRDYNDIVADAIAEWDRIAEQYTATYYPHVSIGWDNSPRSVQHLGQITTNNTPKNVAAALKEAKAFLDARPDQVPLVTINSWNEWTETSYLQPCTMFGYGYLNAVKDVFLGS